MLAAAKVYRARANRYWLASAEPRAEAIEACLAAMPQ
jgi:hypothetical protein